MPSDYTWHFITAAAPDTTPPTVFARSPASGATDVALNASVSAVFSEAMTNSTVNTASFFVRVTGGGAVGGTVNVSGTTATFVPSANLLGSTQYTATITTTARDAAGNPLTSNFTWNFTTAATPDTTRPTVTLTSPANSATGIPLNSTISANFSEAMKNSTLTTANFTLTSGGGAIAGTVAVTSNTAQFRPLANLASSTLYTATITTAVQDAAGNALATNYVWSFQTAAADVTAPTVTTTSPTAGQTGVLIDAPLSATFSEPMINSTLNISSFTLARISGGANVAGSVSMLGETVTFTPLLNLATSTQYRATITNAAKDTAGNSLAANHVWTFTTVAAIPSALLTWSPVIEPNLAGYRVYYGSVPGVYGQTFGSGINAGNVTTYTVLGLLNGVRYYFAVTAYDAAGNESDYSNEVSKQMP